MTASPGKPWPEGVLFWPSWQIPWQTDYSARMFCMHDACTAADVGLGKSVMGLAVAGLCAEQRVTDRVLVVCERNKLGEWLEDFGEFTRLSAAIYHGAKRRRLLEDPPYALITTYETARDDIAIFPAGNTRARKLAPGPLMGVLSGLRVLILYDEVSRLGRRTSRLYKAHYWAAQELRRAGDARCIGMSATPMESDYENIFNELRLLVPHAMPTVAEFERQVIRSRDKFGRPSYRPDGEHWFRQIIAPWILRKRKSDADVREYFPPLTEKFRRIAMHADQRRLYRLLDGMLPASADGARPEAPGLPVLLRQLAGDPWAVLEAGKHGDSQLAKMVAAELAGELGKCSSAKAEELISVADLVTGSGGKLVVFTFFGRTVLPALHRRLGNRPVYLYHGGQSPARNEEQKQAFRTHPGGAILLASDAAGRGINLPEASCIIEYEAARTFAGRQQRAGRGHRLGKADPLTFITFVLEETLEAQASIPSLLRRNRDQDFMLGDEGAEGHVSAADRRSMFAAASPGR